MTTFYVITKYLTFPAAAVKLFWEYLIARICGVLVEDSGSIKQNELCGHIEHRLVNQPLKSFLLCFIPGLLNFLLALPMLFISWFNLFYLGATMYDLETELLSPLFFVYIIMFYFGASLLCNLFPLHEDALNLWDVLYTEKKPSAFLRVLLFVPTCIIKAGTVVEKYGISFIICLCAAAGLILNNLL